ncbi:1-phosphatidylinositol 4,5-bisphosphate phosphodiesterase delta-4-like isoform X1 [Echeneis naucrates]|uniref:Phosphoinositide phospholipase C n=1 Tax=Echeneis naucrates TaxID=173247 RepID=A0A665T6U8_ECHNA|nr:1-phosphatidylinositol 4,5-bisphosphate phosphodiesterase delta-4-like isoform X1 [Echeneis naucrates]XP_029370768.1 1-phosphatidylinositol 4,5-bisphosphate phosphodiesterase delta-4-like isoform X1 [Echeneis naucrates]XP_029370777.1 1-phosphatidylinositol 4,5-bisphosphate phosphodiesterase delta-4-like isoform X1 [Echeneis naucrates]XP_029370787.1 1-phosphatidylinositol 4,5-bisphosphate phosphodiesterase delta-4-like isoform X1 [Echeneis naucrates]XP_029370796.1 1-phosphatidylinositol 4,5-b
MASTASSLRLQGDDNIQSMLVGTVMRKIKSRTWKKQRYFKLQDDCMTIWYKSKKAGNATSTFSVSDVEAVREGHQSEVLLSIADEFPPERCFTLVFRSRRGNLDLVAESAEEAQSWIRGMRKLIENLENMGEREKLDQWIGDWFRKADKNNDGRMNFREVRDLLKMMNVDMNEHHAHRLFTMADKSQSGTLEDDEFVLFYKMLTQREDVLRVFQEYSGDGQKLSQNDLEDFLREEQLEGSDTQQHAKQLIERYEPSDTAKLLNAMTFDGFLMYLGSTEGSIFNPRRRGVYQDMSQPLCHYFISSSHNTYLMEDQLRGQSSVEGYIRALNRGCRCVEVDCWDGANGEPIVYHGHTLTSKILFKDVVSAVGKYAFKVSEYPVILSIENHCGVEQQRVMAQHLNHILGDKLLKSTLDGKAPIRLPSPEDLKGKILVKAKKIGGLEESFNGTAEDSLTGEFSDEDEMAEIEEDNLHRESVLRRVKKSKQRLSKELSDCVVYCKSVHFSSFKHSRIHSKFYEVASFTESKARKQLREAGAEFVHHNSRQLTRVYPSGFRTDSSNFNPQEMWNVGCQIVALNFQTAGEGMDLNDGLFSQNGHCGYVLKPSFMREAEKRFDPEIPQKLDGYKPVTLSIQVISGQQLPKVNIKEDSIVDPLVRVEIHGVPMDNAKQETRYIENNGFNPVWYDTLRFTIHAPGLAVVRFVVEDYDKTSKNDFVGQYTLPFSCMQQGYRHIHLLSRDGTVIPPSSLFVHIRIAGLE